MTHPLNEHDRAELTRIVAYIDDELSRSGQPEDSMNVAIPVTLTPLLRAAIEGHYTKQGWQASVAMNASMRTQTRFPEVLQLRKRSAQLE